MKNIHQDLHYPIRTGPQIASNSLERLITISSDTLLIRTSWVSFLKYHFWDSYQNVFYSFVHCFVKHFSVTYHMSSNMAEPAGIKFKNLNSSIIEEFIAQEFPKCSPLIFIVFFYSSYLVLRDLLFKHKIFPQRTNICHH